MKRIVSIMLVFAILLSFVVFAACANDETGAEQPPSSGGQTQQPTADVAPGATGEGGEPAPGELTEDVLKNSKPNEYVPEKLEAGMEVKVGFDFLNLNDQFYVFFSEGFVAACEELGITCMVSSYDTDAAVQLQHIENYLTMGVACIITMMTDPDSGVDLCAKCEEQGCYFIQQGSVPNGHVSAAVNVDQVQIGTECVKMAQAWVDENYPDVKDGELHVAVLGNTTNSDPAVRTAAMEDAIRADGRFNYVFNNHASLSLDSAFTAVQEAFTYDPEIKIIFTFNVSQAIGANNYITSINGADLTEYAVFCCGINADVTQLIEQSATNDGSVIRGTLNFGGELPWSGVMDAMLGLFYGTYEPGTVIWEPDWAVNSFGYEYSSVA